MKALALLLDVRNVGTEARRMTKFKIKTKKCCNCGNISKNRFESAGKCFVCGKTEWVDVVFKEVDPKELTITISIRIGN